MPDAPKDTRGSKRIFISGEMEQLRLNAKTPPELQEKLEKLKKNELTELVINTATRNESIGNEGIKELAEALKNNHSLTKLSIQGEEFNDANTQLLAEALKNNRSLTKVGFSSGGKLGSKGAAALTQSFAGMLKDNSLKHLWLTANISSEDAKILAEGLQNNNSLTHLSLEGNNIGSEGAIALADALKDNRSLTELSLFSNYIGGAGGAALGRMLKTNSALTELELSSNPIGNEGAKEIGEALSTNQTLTKFNLNGIFGRSRMDSTGVKYLAEGLKNNTSLVELDLSNNGYDIDDKGAAALAEALTKNQSLVSLGLHADAVGDDGAKALAAALKINRTLTTLDLDGDLIGNEGTKALADALKVNSSITKLGVWASSIDNETSKSIQESSQKNKESAPKKIENKAADKETKPAEKTENTTSPDKQTPPPAPPSSLSKVPWSAIAGGALTLGGLAIGLMGGMDFVEAAIVALIVGVVGMTVTNHYLAQNNVEAPITRGSHTVRNAGSAPAKSMSVNQPSFDALVPRTTMNLPAHDIKTPEQFVPSTTMATKNGAARNV